MWVGASQLCGTCYGLLLDHQQGHVSPVVHLPSWHVSVVQQQAAPVLRFSSDGMGVLADRGIVCDGPPQAVCSALLG